MLDLFAVFTRGGALLWTLQFAAMRHGPTEALNTLIRSCLLEERSGDNTFTYTPKGGSAQALKWTFHNGLGLVFVAVYQKALSLMYVDELLTAAKAEFINNHYKPNVYEFPSFVEPFQRLLRECETRADVARKGGPVPSSSNKEVQKASKAASRAAKGTPPSALGSGKAGASKGAPTAAAVNADGRGGATTATEDDEEDGDSGDGAGTGGEVGGSSEGEDGGDKAFDVSKLRGGKAGPRGRPGTKLPPGLIKKTDSGKKEKDDAPKKKARNWGVMGRAGDAPSKLDYSKDAPELTGGSESEAASDAETRKGGAIGGPATSLGVSKMDVEEEEEVEFDDEELEMSANNTGTSASGQAPKKSGLLGSFLANLSIRVVGKTSLGAEDLAPALADMKRKLMERNVAEEIAQNICDSVGRSLEGQRLASFTGVGAFVRRAFEEALAGILHKRQVDMLLDIRKAQERGKPYVVVFCGVNGVGKSTNLAKIAYWLGQHNIKVLIAACDTFRAGAVEQLKTHCTRLGVPLYERGYEKDPAKVASEAIKQAERDGQHVVLVDTAGRMQDNEPLMRALSNLININTPNLVLFVGEALVGNDAVDQLVKFNRALHDLAPAGATTRHTIDGIVLTKFDTIDDKVGAAVSMVYASGAPIMFLGCGQTYADLKRLHVKSVVNALLK